MQALRSTLVHLYDPAALRRSPLAGMFDVTGREDTPSALRTLLTKSIEALKPAAGVPRGSTTWRVYHILHYRFVEQLTQLDVADDLGLGIRQLRRHERLALEALADALWAGYGLEDKAHHLRAEPSPGAAEAVPANAGMPTLDQELDWLKSSIPSEAVRLDDLVKGVLETLAPLVGASHVEVTCDIPADLPPLTLPLTTIRQALLDLVAQAISHAPRGRVAIGAQGTPGRVRVSVRAIGLSGGHASFSPGEAERLEMARELIEICGGVLDIAEEAADEQCLLVEATLPVVEPLTVLALDDNRDTLRLLRKYLAGTRYRLVSTLDPEEVVGLAEACQPRAILLDIMMPGLDGWELLERLREHPQTGDVPVIVCSIVPQENLARLLGAADYIRKPVTRRSLLAALDRHVDPLAKADRWPPQ